MNVKLWNRKVSWLMTVVLIIALLGVASRSAQASTDRPTEAKLPTLIELNPGWNEILPGGDTTCARGDTYKFYVRPGKSLDKLLIFFEGGGACWDGETCQPGSQLFKDKIADWTLAAHSEGIFTTDRPENPLADFTAVLIPYCTGDVHAGNKTVEYEVKGKKITIQHKGFVNTSAVLGWVFTNITAPKNVLVSGCSAGAYGATMYATRVMEQYKDVPGVQVRQLSDCGIGVIDSAWRGLDDWGFFETAAKLAPDLDILKPESFTMSALYKALAARFPKNLFTHYTTKSDLVQTKFYELMGGKDWTVKMDALVDDVIATAPNFRVFVAGGSQHCILQRPEFYTYQANGIPLRDWVDDLVSGKDAPTIRCQNCTVWELVR